MLKRLASVGGFTLLSRVTGFARDVILAAIVGAGTLMDAFAVANRIPNHFRAIFSEGAFSAAFVPIYARVLETRGPEAASRFAGGIAGWLALALAAVTALAFVFVREVVLFFAPGFAARPEAFALAIDLTRITLPYLACVSLVTLLSGVMNAHDRFAVAAGAPILLNVCMVAALAVAWIFPTAAHAAAWGVAAAGVAELALLLGASARAGVLPRGVTLKLGAEGRAFLKALGPAVIGSGAGQIALFADTILASLLPAGGVSSLYYAERLYQLPVGVIGVAAGTVLLPQMAKRFAAGDEAGAHRAQNDLAALSLALALPFAAAFLVLPEAIVAALFGRGAFDAAAAQAAGRVLAAYAVGLPAIVLIRSAVASFHAKSDTRTPLYAALAGIAVNVALKFALIGPLGAPGLALATAAGVWVNLVLLVILAARRGDAAPDARLGRRAAAAALGALAMAGTLAAAHAPILAALAAFNPALREEAALLLTGLAGVATYAAAGFGAALALGVAPRRRGG